MKMDREDVKRIIYELLSLRDELTRYGGAEEAPAIWDEYTKRRSTLYKHFALPETSKNFKLLDPPQIPNGKVLGINLSGLSNDQRYGDFQQLKDILQQMKIIGFVEDQSYNHKQELIVNHISLKLRLRAESIHNSAPSKPLEILEFGKEEKIPAKDLLLLLGYFNEPYQRFLINVILYCRYGTTEHVLKDLKRAQELNNVWALLKINSDLLLEKQIGLDNLKLSGLRFANLFIWMSEDVNFFNNFISVNNDDK